MYPLLAPPPYFVSLAQKTKRLLPLFLFLLTFSSTLLAGFLWHTSFEGQGEQDLISILTALRNTPTEILNGFPFCATVLLFLLAHEMGHYLTCRYYRIQATLPYLLPAPPMVNPFGTFGAVIRIRSPLRNAHQLFDVGMAGPMAGFIFIVPALFIGVHYSKEFIFSSGLEPTFEFGHSLLLRVATTFFFSGDQGSSIHLHQIGNATWLGMFATSTNLLPIGQLDGGHVVYALFGPKVHRRVSLASVLTLVILGFFSFTYLAVALIVSLLGFRHPQPQTEGPELGKGRLLLASLGLLIFIFTFIPVPIRLVQHASRL